MTHPDKDDFLHSIASGEPWRSVEEGLYPDGSPASSFDDEIGSRFTREGKGLGAEEVNPAMAEYLETQTEMSADATGKTRWKLASGGDVIVENHDRNSTLIAALQEALPSTSNVEDFAAMQELPNPLEEFKALEELQASLARQEVENLSWFEGETWQAVQDAVAVSQTRTVSSPCGAKITLTGASDEEYQALLSVLANHQC